MGNGRIERMGRSFGAGGHRQHQTKPLGIYSMDFRLLATAACLTELLARHTVNHIHLSLTVVAIIVVSSCAFHLRVRRAKHSKDDTREPNQARAVDAERRRRDTIDRLDETQELRLLRSFGTTTTSILPGPVAQTFDPKDLERCDPHVCEILSFD
jgi:hypothetical protein